MQAQDACWLHANRSRIGSGSVENQDIGYVKVQSPRADHEWVQTVPGYRETHPEPELQTQTYPAQLRP